MVVKSTAQAAIDLERITINFSGLSRHQGNSWCPGSDRATRRLAAQGYKETKAAMRRFPASFTRFSGRRHVVSAAIVRSIGAVCLNLAARSASPKPVWNPGLAGIPEFLGFDRNRTADNSALAGDGDVFAAARAVAIFVFFRNRAGDFVRINPAVGRGLREIPRLTIGLGSMGTALLAFGKALVDPIAVRLVGDDENPAVGPRCRPG
jgi:hypothetical protein